MRTFINAIVYWVGVLTIYVGIVLLIARILHGRVWSRYDDQAAEEERQRQREANAIWN